ncbi:LytTR family DNA-binding domain-containing protein [Sphingomonas bacterium]|uniref:LytTR family DNA-binding domain-containing protein n=1 Tax=Sphingomonas bacterium TaxID=1895847 RepID=UPI001577395B|nr:LytTR family DNA-binding domain-containing protein [Sphingomonas bacterium]
MTLAGTVIAGLVVPLAMRVSARLGLPRSFALAVGLLVAAVPISVVSALVTGTIWPWQTAALRPLDWYGQTLLVELCVVVLWLLVEIARRQRSAIGPAVPVEVAATPLQPRSADPVLCLQMEDHYVRVHRRSGSTLELMTFAEAIARHGSLNGMQVHRSWWVAADSVEAGERDARNWRLRLANGLLIPVARNRIAEARAQGWIDANE